MYLKIMKVMGKNWRRQSEKLTRSSWLFEITWLDIELMHEAVILLSFSICFWQLLNKNKQLLSLLICCADQLKKEMTKMGQNIRWCWNHSQMCCLWNSYHFQSLFLANTQQKCTVRWHLMFVCGKAQFEKEMTKTGIKQTIMRKPHSNYFLSYRTSTVFNLFFGNCSTRMYSCYRYLFAAQFRNDERRE